jgi:hypothetical protein
MSRKLDTILATAVLRLLHPLVRILLRNGVAYGTLAGWIRQVYVDVAFEDFAPEGKKQTISRVSALTGLTRKEVKRLVEKDEAEAEPGQARYSRAIRVISGWLKDRRFQDEQGKPGVLPVEGRRNSFALLVKEYSGDIPTRAMLAMLEEAGSVKVVRDKVRLVRRAYVPGSDAVEKIRILGSDVYELVSTIDHNLTAGPDELRFQRKVAYDNIDPVAAEKLKKMSAKKAQQLLEYLDKQLASNELDEGTAERGKYISVGIYYHEQDSSED